MLQKKSAFTLIETLVAIALIGILAGIVIIAINPARQLSQARNAARKANVKEIIKAITTYQIDQRGSVPVNIDGVLTMIGTATSNCATICGEADAQLVRQTSKISSITGDLGPGLGNNDQFGYAIAPIGDLNNDYVPDLAIGTINDDDGGNNRGAVYVLLMNSTGTVATKQKISTTEGGFGAGLDNGDYFGSAVAEIGDLDGDGIKDLAVGAYLDDDGGTNFGAVYILFMNQNGTVKAKQKISALSGGLAAGLGANDRFGRAVTDLGDVDGDGIPDIAVGAYQDDDGGNNRGAIYILFLKADGTVKRNRRFPRRRGE